MKRAIFTSLILLATVVVMADGAELTSRARKLLQGRTVEADFGFPAYRNRSARSVAEEFVANGISGVYYFVTAERGVRKDIIAELHKRGIPVAAMAIASGAYMPADERPQGWEKYRMEFTNSRMDEYKFMSFVHREYALWMKERIVKLINEYGFDGFTFAEAMYPITDGLERKDVLYGDISPSFQEAFKKATGDTVFPEFVDETKPNYYKNVPKIYNDLVEFRIRTVNDFYDEVVNGKDGIRQKCPGVFVATWTMGISIPNGVEKLREWEGQDIPSMITRVKPDMHFIQTHWPDWSNHALKGDYALLYKPFFDLIKKTDPNLPIGFQADLVSEPGARRPPEWQKLFYQTCDKLKIDCTTYYVFSLRWAVYNEAPQLCNVQLVWKDVVELCFDKRISDECAKIVLDRKVIVADSGKSYSVRSAEVDGNLLKMVLDGDLSGTDEISVDVGGIKDDPEYRLAPKGVVNTIPAGTIRKLPLQ